MVICGVPITINEPEETVHFISFKIIFIFHISARFSPSLSLVKLKRQMICMRISDPFVIILHTCTSMICSAEESIKTGKF